MCDVHLVPTSVVFDIAEKPSRCSDCRRWISRGTPYIEVVGHLDNGSNSVYTFSYHPNCYTMLDTTIVNDGCFSYGVPAKK